MVELRVYSENVGGVPDLWRAVFENIEGVLKVTPEGVIVSANPTACRLFGRTEDELRQLRRADVVVHDERFEEFLTRRNRDGHARGLITLRRRDGSSFLASVSSIIVQTADGPCVSLLILDLTEQLRAHRALEIVAKAGRVLAASLDVDETLRRLLDLVVPEIADLCAVDLLQGGEIHRVFVSHRDPAQAELVRANRRRNSQKLLGVESVIETGKPLLVSHIDEAFMRANTHDAAHFEQTVKMGVTSAVVVPLVARGRTLGAFSLASTGRIPAYDESDLSLAGAIGDQAALALDNAYLHAAAIEAARLRDEALGIVSHDLKNPLNTIKLSVGSLALHTQTEEAPVIRRAVQRAERLIADLQLVSKMNGGAIPIDRSPTSVKAIVDGVVALHHDAAKDRSLTLSARVDGEPDEVAIDRHRVTQMLDNLVGNAVRCTDRGSVEIRARITSTSVVIEVEDTGRGIEPEALPHVFDRFWQSVHANRAGAGLGLAIANGVARAHGGDITVETAVGKGTTFTATLLLYKPAS
jgi:PAS domain S-box-containing protein